MSTNYHKSGQYQSYSAAFEKFLEIIELLQSPTMGLQQCYEVEKVVMTNGRELQRLLLQGFLKQKGESETRLPSVVDQEQRAHPHVRTEKRNLATLFGPVEVKRKSYGGAGLTGLCPLDGELNMPGRLYSFGVKEQLAALCGKMSFDEAVSSLAQTTGTAVPKRQAEEMMREVGQDFLSYYGQQRPASAEQGDLLVLSLDGKGIVVRTEDLRAQTRKAAERAAGRGRKKRLGKGEKRNRKRMATVAAVYDIKPQPRRGEDIMGLTEEESAPGPAVKPQYKRVWARITAELNDVAREVFEEALRRDPQQQRRWCFLVDGDPRQLRCIRRWAKHYGVTVTVVLDFIHVLEYLWKAAYCFHAEGSAAAKSWVSERALKVLRGQVSGVAQGMRTSATKQGLAKAARKSVDVCAQYLLGHKNQLRYDEYLAEGLPIATGVIEGACRHLIKDRMDVTGARWSMAGAEAVLRVRALCSSGDFEDYWRFHMAQEQQRNHNAKYATVPWREAA